MVGTSDAAIDINNVENLGIYGGDSDIDDEGYLSCHSSDGLDKDDSVCDLSLGNGTEGTSPLANARKTTGQSLLGTQNDDLPDWFQEMFANQAYRIFSPAFCPCHQMLSMNCMQEPH